MGRHQKTQLDLFKDRPAKGGTDIGSGANPTDETSTGANRGEAQIDAWDGYIRGLEANGRQNRARIDGLKRGHRSALTATSADERQIGEARRVVEGGEQQIPALACAHSQRRQQGRDDDANDGQDQHDDVHPSALPPSKRDLAHFLERQAHGRLARYAMLCKALLSGLVLLKQRAMGAVGIGLYREGYADTEALRVLGLEAVRIGGAPGSMRDLLPGAFAHVMGG